MALGERKLIGVHVNAYNLALGADELARQVDVATGAAAQVEHGAAFERRRERASATIETRGDFLGDLG